MKIILSLIVILSVFTSNCQDKTFGARKTAIKLDSVQKLNFNTTNKGKVMVHKDSRLENVTKFVGRQKESIEGTKIDGYRIQIFFNESRKIAQSQKASFMSVHGEHKSYLDYLAPNYRIRVGNFRTKLQAEKFKQELISVYPTCIVVKDKIELPVITLEE